MRAASAWSITLCNDRNKRCIVCYNVTTNNSLGYMWTAVTDISALPPPRLSPLVSYLDRVQYKRVVITQFRNVVTEYLQSTHLTVYDARFKYDPLFGVGFYTSFMRSAQACLEPYPF